MNTINQDYHHNMYFITIMSVDLTKRGFIKYVLVILAVVIAYFIGALFIIDYFPH
jgi:hypothetical protein